jgi:hypothetical protein
MKFNEPFIMVASVGSKEDAQMNTNHLLADWKVVTGKKVLKKLNKKTQVEIPKSERINQNALHVFVKATEKKKINDEEEKEERKIKSVPHKQFKAEALKKKKKTVIKSKKASVTSKEFSNKKFQKLLDQGVKDLKDFYKIPCVLQKVMSLCVETKQTIKYLVKQLEFFDMLKDLQIARLPKYFRPYAELHFKKAFDGKLPDNVMDDPKHIFPIFHKMGRQKRYTSSYKAHLHQLISHMTPVFNNPEDFDDEKYKFDESTEWFFGTIGDQIREDEKMHIFNNKPEKQNKNKKNKKPKYKAALTCHGGKYQCFSHNNDGHYFHHDIKNQEDDMPILVNQDEDIPDFPDLIAQDEASQSTAGYDSESDAFEDDTQTNDNKDDEKSDKNSNDDASDVLDLIDQSVSTAQYDSEDAFSLSDDENEDIILVSAFGAQVTFIDDNNNVVTLGGDTDDEGIILEQQEDPRLSDGFIGSEVSNIAIRSSMNYCKATLLFPILLNRNWMRIKNRQRCH